MAEHVRYANEMTLPLQRTHSPIVPKNWASLISWCPPAEPSLWSRILHNNGTLARSCSHDVPLTSSSSLRTQLRWAESRSTRGAASAADSCLQVIEQSLQLTRQFRNVLPVFTHYLERFVPRVWAHESRATHGRHMISRDVAIGTSVALLWREQDPTDPSDSQERRPTCLQLHVLEKVMVENNCQPESLTHRSSVSNRWNGQDPIVPVVWMGNHVCRALETKGITFWKQREWYCCQKFWKVAQ